MAILGTALMGSGHFGNGHSENNGPYGKWPFWEWPFWERSLWERAFMGMAILGTAFMARNLINLPHKYNILTWKAFKAVTIQYLPTLELIVRGSTNVPIIELFFAVAYYVFISSSS